MASQAFIRKVSNEIKRVVGRIIAGELKDPRVGMASVVHVDLSPCLRHAKIFVSVVGDERQRNDTMAGIKHATGHIRTELGERTRLKYIPELVFFADTSVDYAQHIDQVLKSADADKEELE